MRSDIYHGADNSDQLIEKVERLELHPADPAIRFVRFEQLAPFSGEISRSFDDSSAYQTDSEEFKRYRSLRICYVWGAGSKSVSAFGLKKFPDASADNWRFDLSDQKTTIPAIGIAIFDASRLGIRNGYPAEPLNIPPSSPPDKAKMFRAWDQYGNYGTFQLDVNEPFTGIKFGHTVK